MEAVRTRSFRTACVTLALASGLLAVAALAHADPGPGHYLKLASTAKHQGRLDDAIRHYEDCIEIFADRPGTVLLATARLINVHKLLEDQPAVEAAMVRVRSLAPGWQMTANDYYALGSLEKAHGDLEAAADRLNEALDTFLAAGDGKGAIRAASLLLDGEQDGGAIHTALERLQAIDEQQLDAKDKDRLGRLLLRHRHTEPGLDELWEVVVAQAPVGVSRRKVVLRAFERLAGVYGNRGDDEGLGNLAAKLDLAFPTSSTWELVDREHLARINARLDRIDAAVAIWQEIVASYEDNPEPEQKKAFIRAQVALATHADQQPTPPSSPSLDLRDRYRLAQVAETPEARRNALHEIVTAAADPSPEQVPVLLDALSSLLMDELAAGGTSELAAWAAQSYPTQAFAANERYRLGMMLLKHGQQQAAEQVLAELAAGDFGDPTRKALFILAKEAHRRGESDLAIQRYLYYVTRFPDNGLFTLEAYSDLVDVYFSTARSEKATAMLGQLRQVAGGTLDWQGQLNTARQLHRYQQGELVDATFSLGLTRAFQHLSATPDPIERIRVQVEIARYAADCELGTIALEQASAAADQAEVLDRGPMVAAQLAELDRLHALALLIIVKAAAPADVVNAASDFLVRFPRHPDRDFVTWFLGKAFEAQGKNTHAIETYGRVGGAFQDSARQRLEALR